MAALDGGYITVTPQELKMVCQESNEIHGKNIVLCSTAEKKKLFAFDKVGKNVRLSWESEKNLITNKNHSPPPPHQMVCPLELEKTSVLIFLCLDYFENRDNR